MNYYSRGLALEPSDVGYILLARALEAAGAKVRVLRGAGTGKKTCS